MTTATTPSVSAEITDVPAYCLQLAQRAQAAANEMVTISGKQRDAALHAIADAIDANSDTIQQQNALDLEAGAENGLSQAMLDRLKLDGPRIAKVAQAVREIAAQPDPVGGVIEGRVLPNGLRLEKRRVPIGVFLMIFESRPNVTSDAAALSIKSGNSVILRGGKEAKYSNAAIANCVREGLAAGNLPTDAVQMVETTDRAAVGELLKLEGLIDICVPRGGKSLIRAVVDQARIPVIKHYTGNCHVYVDEHANEQMAIDICVNAKTQRTGVCNAAETIIVHQKHVETGLLKQIVEALQAKGTEVRGDEAVQQVASNVTAATDEDWGEEYLDLIVAIKTVGSLDEAVKHINAYGSKHTDAIVTNDINTSNAFINRVDTANAFVNCSTRFSDGGEYGLGAEIGISTDKLHARGPMGAADLTTYKWIALGNGQTRN